MSEKTLNIRVSQIANNLPMEFRKPVMEAAQNSDGTFLGFQEELNSQVWDHPELPVQDILDKVSYDL